MKAKWWYLVLVLVAGLIAFVGCLPVFEIIEGDDDWKGYLAILTLPGVLLSLRSVKDAHALNAWTIFWLTWAFYAVVFVAARIAWSRLRVR